MKCFKPSLIYFCGNLKTIDTRLPGSKMDHHLVGIQQLFPHTIHRDLKSTQFPL